MGNVLVKEVEEFNLVISEKIDFDINKKEEYLEIFKEKRKSGSLIGEFEDLIWIWVYGGKERAIIFPSQLDFYELARIFTRGIKEFEMAYKTFIMLNVNHSCIQGFNSKMKSVKKGPDDFLNTPYERLLFSFINFIKLPYKNKMLFKNVIENSESKKDSIRILPRFIDTFKFSDIINDIVENKNLLDYKRYLMTIMWWKICSVVPLRASEFTKIIFDCVDIENDKYVMKLKRSYAKGGRDMELAVSTCLEDDIYYDDKVVIDETMYMFIKKFQEFVKKEFNYEGQEKLLARCLITQTAKKSSRNGKKLNKNQIIYQDLYSNLENFYNEVVCNEYGFIPVEKYIKRETDKKYIEKLTLHDARHIAIINLILLGVDILEVMYLSGHKNINTTYGYYNHVKEITNSYAIAYKNRKESNKNISNNDIMIVDKLKNENIKALEKIKYGESKNLKYPKVKGGYCKYLNIKNDKSMCRKVERIHVKCPFFLAKSVEVFNDRIREVDKEIDIEISLLKDMIADMHKISKFNELYQSASYRLEQNIVEKIILSTKI